MKDNFKVFKPADKMQFEFTDLIRCSLNLQI